jgi:hypothetical protein
MTTEITILEYVLVVAVVGLESEEEGKKRGGEEKRGNVIY